MSIIEHLINKENLKELKVKTDKSSQLRVEILNTLLPLIDNTSTKISYITQQAIIKKIFL